VFCNHLFSYPTSYLLLGSGQQENPFQTLVQVDSGVQDGLTQSQQAYCWGTGWSTSTWELVIHVLWTLPLVVGLTPPPGKSSVGTPATTSLPLQLLGSYLHWIALNHLVVVLS